jgi:TolA-binding protein
VTNQALPEAIQRQLDEAAALEKQVYGQPAPEGNTEVVEPAATSEAVVEPVVAPVAQPEPVAQDEDESFRRKYDVLRGKFDAEVPRLHAQLREATGQLQQAFAEIQHLRSVVDTRAQPEQTATDNDAETFGEDLTQAIDRRAKAIATELAGKQTQQLMQHIRQLESRLGEVNEHVEVNEQDRFLTQLSKIVPDYETVNVEQGFLNWLGEADPVYGVPRQAALDAASERGDAAQVANVFLAYKQLTGKQVKSQQREQSRQELERQVAPNTPSGSAATPTAGKVISRADYEYAYDPRTIRELGQAKAEELMAAADAAYAEGRVRW